MGENYITFFESIVRLEKTSRNKKIVIFTLLFMLAPFLNTWGQCAAYTTNTACTTAAPTVVSSSISCTPPNNNGGRRNFLVTNMIAGYTYRVSNCGSGYDTQMTIRDNGGVSVAYNDDDGPACTGTAASIDFIPPTNGDYRIQLNRWDCSTTNALNGTITVTLTSVPAACSGTPTAGTITVTPTSGAPGSTYGVTATGYTTGASLTYQWQYSDTGTALWTDQGTATSSYAALTGMTAPAFGVVRTWRLVVTCTPSGGIANSTTGTFTSTYCIPTSTFTSDYISGFSTTGGLTNISNTPTTLSGTGYGNFYATHTASQYAGSALNFTETYAGGSHGLSIWVDFNNNGVFEASERLYNAGATATGFTGTITIPGGTTAGDYRMRVRAWWNNLSPDPCANIAYGEAEDYKLTVLDLLPCSGTPTAGSVTVTPISGTPGSAYGVTATGYTTGTSLTYQWQYSDTGGAPWTDQGTATSSYAALTGMTAPAFGVIRTWRLVVTCTPSASSANSTTGTFTSSYCLPIGTTSYWITNFTTTSGVTNINNTSANSNIYGNYTATAASQYAGSALNLSITTSSGTHYFYGWVDWNNDGDFLDVGEAIFSTATYTAGYTGSYTISAVQPAGSYRMRIANSWSGAITSCSAGGYSEYEDYTLTVLALCPVTVASATSDGVCGSGIAEINATGSAGTTALYLYSSASGGTPIDSVTGTTGTLETTSIALPTTFYVAAYNGTCESLRVPVNIIIKPVPSAVVITPGTPSGVNLCDYSIPLVASGGTIASSTPTTFLTSGFETGETTGWVIENISGSTAADWAYQAASHTGTRTPRTGTRLASFDSRSFTNYSGKLISPSMDLSSASGVSLNFWYQNPLWSPDQNVLRVYYRTSGVGAWTLLNTYNTNVSAWTNVNINLPSLTATYQIAFEGTSYYGYSIVVDDVTVSGLLNITVPTDITWSPISGLYTDASLSTTYTGTATTTVYAKPLLTTNYTATSTSAQNCTSSSSYEVVTTNKNFNITGNWNNPGNWLPNGVPTNGDCVTILSGRAATINSGTAEAKTLLIENTGSITVTSNQNLIVTNQITNNSGGTNFVFENNSSLIQIDNVANIGDIRYNRTSPLTVHSTDYVYWSSPVNNQTIPSGLNYTWNNSAGTTGNWVSAVGQSMTEGKGFIMRGVGSKIFTGVPYNGEISVNVFRRNLAGYNDNWNLIGNPYASAISADEFISDSDNTAIEGSVAIWTHGSALSNSNPNPFYGSFAYNYNPNDYIIYNSFADQSGPSVFNGYIAAGQAFFVKYENDDDASPVNASTTVKFKNTMRTNDSGVPYNNSQFYRPSQNTQSIEKHRIWLDLISENSTSATTRTVVGYAQNATNEKDRLYDASTGVTPANIILYSLIGTKKMSIQAKGLPFDDIDTIPLGYNAPSAGNYKIAIHAVDGLFQNNQDIFLEDTQNGIIHDLRLNPYSFTTITGENNTRFKLKFNNETLSNEDFVINNIIVFTNENINLNATNQTIKSVRIHDLLGRVLGTFNNVNSNIFETKNISKTQSALLVEVTFDNGTTKTYKVIF